MANRTADGISQRHPHPPSLSLGRGKSGSFDKLASDDELSNRKGEKGNPPSQKSYGGQERESRGEAKG